MSEISSAPSRPTTPAYASVIQTPTTRPYRFTWDHSSRPGPESVSGTTEGRGGDYVNQPIPIPTPFPLGTLNTSTVNLALGALPAEWSSSKHGFHAISTVLNNPHKTQAPPKAHSSLPAVPPADLPRVRRKDFDSYLKAIIPEWERFERNNRFGREGQAQLNSSALQSHDDDDTVSSLASDTGHRTPTTNVPSFSSIPSASSRRGSLLPVNSGPITPLESIPSVFFERTFDLANPSTFTKVTEQPSELTLLSPSAVISAPTDDITDLTSSATPPLHDKFSHYADIVEQHLVREISLRSTSFFAALTNLQDLQSESDVCLDRIVKLRGLLKDVDERTAKKGLEVVKKYREVGVVQGIREAVRSVENVIEMTGVAKGLVSAGQWGEALNVVEELKDMQNGVQVESTENMKPDRDFGKKLETMTEDDEEGEDFSAGDIAQKPTLGFPLSALTAFSELPIHLRVLTLEISKSLSQEMIVVLRHDLEERLGHSQDTSTGTNEHAARNERDLRDRLKPLLQNLLRTKGLGDATLEWRDVVLSEVRRVPKEMISGFDKEWDEEEEEKRMSLVQYLKGMEHQHFMPLLQKVYQRFLALVEGIQAQNALIIDILDSIQKSTSSRENFTSQDIVEDLSDLLSSTAELSHTTSSQFLHARTEPHSLLSLPRFLALYFDSMAFVVKCEILCRRMIIGLRGVVIRQASLYLTKFHQGRIERCAKVVLDEMWNQVDVGVEVQSVVDVLVRCAVKDAEELKIDVEGVVLGSPSLANGVRVHQSKENGVSSPSSPRKLPKLRAVPPTKTFAELSQMEAVPSSDSKESTKSSGSTKDGAKHLKIEDRSYFVVSATAEVLVLLIDYLKIVINLSTLTKDTITKVVEFLMTFNSRTCQLVLGAGAMRSAGLKHITAKHLALASQSLSVVSELIPYVRETFRRHLNQAEAVLLVDFDKLKRDYQVHQTEIHAKLISIMGDRLSVHIETLKGIDWSQAGDGHVNGYMQTLVKETVTLHKVLSRYLSAAVVEFVMTEVFAGINHRLSEVYGNIELPNQDSKARLLADARFLHKELSGLKNVVGAPMGMLETVVSEKLIPRAMVLSSSSSGVVQGASRSSTLSANQRLKGLLSRSSAIKGVRSPTQTIVSPRSPSRPPSSLQNVQHGIASVDDHQPALNEVLLSGSPPLSSQDGLEGAGSPDVETVEPEEILPAEGTADM